MGKGMAGRGREGKVFSSELELQGCELRDRMLDRE